VIGATNRPDAIDPALRRPGRFDREFYFPLPNIEARKKILGIHTKGWNPPLEDSFMDELADLTKGYGGADLRVSSVSFSQHYRPFSDCRIAARLSVPKLHSTLYSERIRKSTRLTIACSLNQKLSKSTLEISSFPRRASPMLPSPLHRTC